MSWPNFYLNFPLASGLDWNHTVLDIGCRDLRSQDDLIAYLSDGSPMGAYLGVDLSQDSIEMARAKIETCRNGNVRVRHSTTFGLEECAMLSIIPDRVLTFAVLLHLTDEQVVECALAVSCLMSAKGKWLADLNVRWEGQGCWEGYPVIRRSLFEYDRLMDLAGLEIKVLGEVREFGYHASGKASRNLAVEITGR